MPHEHEELIDDESEAEGVETADDAPDDDAAKDGDGEGHKGKGEGPSLRELQRELRELRKSQEELTRTAEYWRGKAEGKAGAANAEPEEDEEEITVEDDLVDAISSNDATRVAKALKSMGFVREKDVRQTIASTRAAMTAEAKLIQQFPDLADESSEFYEATKKHYRELVKEDPALAQSPATLKTAARMAQLELGEAATAEESRAARVSRQAGGRTVRATAGSKAGNQDLSPAQRRIIENLRAAGADISEEGYRKRATGGVRMAGIRRGRS